MSVVQGKQIIEIYESFDGSYWYITEKLYKQDTIAVNKAGEGEPSNTEMVVL